MQLETLAYKVYKRPLAAFFLPEPPQEKGPENDFRTLPEEELQALLPNTYLNIRQARAYQTVLRELFGDVNPNSNPIWCVIDLSKKASVEKQAAKIRTFLGISLEEQGKWSNDDLALKQWRSAVEDGGVFVFKNALKQKSISSFCLNDEQFPIICLNNSTTKTRQIFSLFHELAHVLLRMNGLSKSDESYIGELPKREQKIEKFCNALAAEILIPTADFAQRARPYSSNVEGMPDTFFETFSGFYGVSREAVLRRFLDDGKISFQFYENKAKQWTLQQKRNIGGDYYLNLKTYLSNNLSKEVFSRYYQGRLTKDEASECLGIKPKQFNPLEETMLRGMEA